MAKTTPDGGELIEKISAQYLQYRDVVDIDGEPYVKITDVSKLIDAIPPYEEPPRIGQWVTKIYCSLCGKAVYDCYGYDYCPHCGAEMKPLDEE